MDRYGLYYPYMHFRDDAWLKASALYLPRIVRMVPPGYRTLDSVVVRTLADELGFVTSVDPSPVADAASTELLSAMRPKINELHWRRNLRVGPESKGCSPTYSSYPYPSRIHEVAGSGAVNPRLVTARVEARLSRRNPSVESNDPWGGREKLRSYAENVTSISFAQSGTVGLHPHELSEELRSFLLEEGLGVSGDVPGWVGVSPSLAWIHLSGIASRIADRNHLSPITDDPMFNIIRHDLSFDEAWLGGTGTTVRDPGIAVGALAVQLVIPANLNDLPIEKILEIRKRYGAEFDAFRATVEKLASDVSGQIDPAMDTELLKVFLDDEVRKKFGRQLKDLRSALRGLRVDTTLAATGLKVEMPAAIGAATAGLLAGSPLIAGAGAVAFSVIGFARGSWKSRASALSQSPASYLFQVERSLKPAKLLRRLGSGQRR